MNLMTEIRDLLEQKGIFFLPGGPDSFRLGFIDPEGVFYGDLIVDEEHRFVFFQMVPPLTAPQEKMLQMLELVARANGHILQGNLEINLLTGLLTCRTSIILGDSSCPPDILYHMLGSSCWEIRRWFPAIKAVAMGLLSPEQATVMILQQQGNDQDDVNYSDTSDDHLGDIQYGSMN